MIYGGAYDESRIGMEMQVQFVELYLVGSLTPATLHIIEYITIASEGNAIDFGDLTKEDKLVLQHHQLEDFCIGATLVNSSKCH